MKNILRLIFDKFLGHKAWAGLGVFIAIIALLLTIFPSSKKVVEDSQDEITKKQQEIPIFVSQRIALVIGNSYYQSSQPIIKKNPISLTRDLKVQTSSYTNISAVQGNRIIPLKNPINDARLIIKLLEKRNFKIISGFNLKKNEMIELIQKFQIILATGGTGVFYYSGHAVNIGGNDYMLPITDKNISSEESFLKEAINVTKLLDPVEKIIRKHPKKTGAAIFYAANEGSVAFDGVDKNSPFAKAISNSISKDKKSDGLFNIFINIAKDVSNETFGKQTPWFSSSTFSDFYFNNQRKDEEINLMKILFIDACRDNPFHHIKRQPNKSNHIDR